MSTVKYILCIAILAVSFKSIRALSDEEKSGIFEKFQPHIAECSKELDIEEDALKDAKEKKSIDGIDNCFFACIFKKVEVMDDKGMYDPKKAIEQMKGHITKEEVIKKATEVLEECSAVNSEDVSDGEAGCDRAKLLMSCFIKHKQSILDHKE